MGELQFHLMIKKSMENPSRETLSFNLVPPPEQPARTRRGKLVHRLLPPVWEEWIIHTQRSLLQ